MVWLLFTTELPFEDVFYYELYGYPFANIQGNHEIYIVYVYNSIANYNVNHYVQTLDNGILSESFEYELYYSETVLGFVDDLSNAEALDLLGFTSLEIEQQIVKYDESTVVNIYYNIKKY